MAGKRQHFIPQFLQEGFASQVSGGDAYAWVYRKGTPPFNSNVRNIGVESHFYTEGDDTRADDVITEAEPEFAALVQRLRDSDLGIVREPQLPRFIAHLEVRTRHLKIS